jgi:ribosomal protein S15P/S13E
VRIAAQLRSEGLIREPGSAPIPVPPSARRWRVWLLAPVAAALIAAGSYVVNHKPAAQMAQQVAPPAQAPAVAPAQGNSPESAAKTPTESAAIAAAPKQTAQTKSAVVAQKSVQTNAAATIAKTEVEPGPNQDDRQFLSMVSTRAPSQRAAYENQLQAVNANIRQVQEYLQRNPGDADARQQLMDAYQQKALLYQIALDRIQ